jgi:hypothetical protein
VNLSSLGFFRSLRKENQQFAVIGLGALVALFVRHYTNLAMKFWGLMLMND